MGGEGKMGQNGEGQQGANVPDQSAVDKFQSTIDARSFGYETTGLVDSLFGNAASAKTALDKAKSIESTPVAAGGGGGYKFTPAQIEDQLQQCTDLIKGLQTEGLRNAGKIAACKAPAKDTVASVPQAQAVSQLGQRLVQRVQNQITFIENWMDQLKAVRQSYLDQEGHTEAMWKQMSGGLYT